MSLSERMKWLVARGCYPCVSYRGGGVFRAHVNGPGNIWHEALTPHLAMEQAVRLWLRRRKPMDGYAAQAKSGVVGR